MKRAFDVVFSACFLWFVLPLLIFAAVGIALTSRGPIFYRAERMGKGNFPFGPQMMLHWNLHLRRMNGLQKNRLG